MTKGKIITVMKVRFKKLHKIMMGLDILWLEIKLSKTLLETNQAACSRNAWCSHQLKLMEVGLKGMKGFKRCCTASRCF